MRARSSIVSSSLFAVALAVASGCSRDDGPVVLSDEPATAGPTTSPTMPPTLDPPRDPAPVDPRRRLGVLVETVSEAEDENIGDVSTPILTRLVYQCSDDVTFAVRIAGNRLEVFPPGISNNYIVLMRVPSESGVRYTAVNAEFRAKDDLAALRVDAERHVDCVSNPAATVWGAGAPGAAR
jgi:membrane-bound inhibitor of C-type lysozyme